MSKPNSYRARARQRMSLVAARIGLQSARLRRTLIVVVTVAALAAAGVATGIHFNRPAGGEFQRSSQQGREPGRHGF